MKKLTIIFFTILSITFFAQSKKDIGENFIKTLFLNRNAEEARKFFDSSITDQIPLEDLKSLPAQLEEQIGKFINIIEINNDQNIYYYYSKFSKSKVDVQITFTDNSKIIGFYILPHKDFIKEDDKTSLKIKSDGLDIKGTLLQPTEHNKKKLVIFVHGSGASDRNETIGQNSPFKDIAEYLLKSGISSYRYDKRSYSYPETFNDASTVEQESINDAINISNYFKNNSEYKDYQIILLGHSLGAYLMPRIASNANASKYIFLSGNSRPLQDLLLDQFVYLNKFDDSSVSKQDIQKLKNEISLLDSEKFNLDIPKENLPLKLSATYWNYLLHYNPLNEVKLIKVPMFFAQGGKDYQVTEKDFTLWKSQLKNNKSAEFKFYPELNHLYIKVLGVSSPKDYELKGRVDQLFLADLTNFILK